ncbi:ribosome-inactivating family protein [Streptomyces sp. NPDC002817]|uniref:ribosome-inactivating family protein n=1 Tax=Streptomyces sp. NPDC088357 TaxID=3154655 RepID=UPI00343B0AEB
MSHPDLTTSPAQRRHRTRRNTVGTIVATVVLAIFATLLGPLGVVQSASAWAPDKGSVARWKVGDRTGYAAFINALREAIRHGSAAIPGTSRQITHTNPDSRDYINVDVEEQHSQRFVTLRLRASDLYLMGWWGGARGHEQYHYVGEAHGQQMPGVPGDGDHNNLAPVQAPFGENYVDLERQAGASRTEIDYSQGAYNGAVLALIHAPSKTTDRAEVRRQARSFLIMVQALSEAARFRPMANFNTASQVDHAHNKLDGRYVSMQNRWSEFSAELNDMEATGAHRQPENALTQWIWEWIPDRNTFDWVLVPLTDPRVFTVLLMTVKGPPKKKG